MQVLLEERPRDDLLPIPDVLACAVKDAAEQ
jgi:hypothetical protein